jgi:hypothetical protein
VTSPLPINRSNSRLDKLVFCDNIFDKLTVLEVVEREDDGESVEKNCTAPQASLGLHRENK